MDYLSQTHRYARPDSTASTITEQFDLVAYARKHRYRLRNLHDGGPVPPALPKKSDTHRLGYVGAVDRWDAIVGHNGYVAMDGDRLSVFVEYKSANGVNRAVTRLQAGNRSGPSGLREQ